MKKAAKFLVPLLLGLLILASIFWYLFMYDRAFTRDVLLGQARFHDTHGNSRMSAGFYDAAYSFSGHDDNVAIELANQYRRDGNYTKAEYTLTKAIASNPSAEGYSALCRTYAQQDKLLDAVALLDNLGNASIKAQLDSARPKAPAADRTPGYYSQYIDVHLTSDAGSRIYYTTDGQYPSINGPVLEDSIPLEAGQTTISAVAVSQEGLVSPLVVLNYTVTGVIEEVVFTDPILESAIRAAIGADADRTVMTDALWEITEFVVPAGVASYADLSLLPNVRKLTFEPEQLPGLDFLGDLTKLEDLDLSGCRFRAEALSALTTLPSLKHLTLVNCGLSTIEDLTGVIALHKLDLGNNTIRNLDAISSMVTLRELNLQHNAVTDLSGLGNLGELEYLNVAFNSLSGLSPLSGCANLKTLQADNNQIYSVAGVETLSQLTTLNVAHNRLSDVSSLAAMTGLKDLNIASNTITDISGFSALSNLENLNFSANQISQLPQWPEGCVLQTIDGSYNSLSSLDVLKDMDSLTHVYMDYNLITNIDALADCYRLVQINVFGNKIADVDKLREHDIIVNYDPTFGMES